MRLRSRAWLAWLVFLATFACLLGGLVVTLLVTRPLTADELVNGAYEGAIWLLFATIGLVMTLRRPANPIGWLYAAAGLAWTLNIPWDPWVDRLLRANRPLPTAAQLAALAGDSLWAVGLTLPSPCRCCCSRTGGCARPAGGRCWWPPWPARPPTWSAGSCRPPR